MAPSRSRVRAPSKFSVPGATSPGRSCELLGDRERALIDDHADAHGRAQRDLLQVLALGLRRLGLDQVGKQRVQVAAQRRSLEAGLADGAVDDAGLVGAVTHLA